MRKTVHLLVVTVDVGLGADSGRGDEGLLARAAGGVADGTLAGSGRRHSNGVEGRELSGDMDGVGLDRGNDGLDFARLGDRIQAALSVDGVGY